MKTTNEEWEQIFILYSVYDILFGRFNDYGYYIVSFWKEKNSPGKKRSGRKVRTKVTSIQRPARLKYYELSWYAGGYEYFGELWFQEEEMLHLFDEAYEEDRMQEHVFKNFEGDNRNVFRVK